ncbi:MAG: hypothetical protein E7001_08115 [Coriobacteriaceae bacterium]|nr:hypothetical protein [Coriobacteriaceae bacterium]
MGTITSTRGSSDSKTGAAPVETRGSGPVPPPSTLAVRDSGIIVARDHLVSDIIRQVRAVGIVVVCAPFGFGKTALMLQIAAAARSDSEPGTVRLIGGDGLSVRDLAERLEHLADELSGVPEPMVLVDEVQAVDGRGAEAIAECARRLRAMGAAVVLSCAPSSRVLVHELGDSYKVGPSALAVQPGEFTRWSKALALSCELDGYGLTRGIPLLVTALRTVARGEDGTAHLEARTAMLYRSVLAEAKAARGSLSRLIPILLLLERGSFSDLERCGMRVRGAVLDRLSRDYPVFDIDAEGRGFSCLGASGAEMAELRREIMRGHPELHAKAVRAHIRARRVDRAITLMEQGFSKEQRLEMIGGYPAAFACAGRADFVRATVNGIGAERTATVDVGVVLALYLSSLLVGDYRMARTTSTELCRRASEIEGHVDAAEWGVALAFREVWATCQGIDLPSLSPRYLQRASSNRALLLREHARICHALVGKPDPVTGPARALQREADAVDADEIDIPETLFRLSRSMVAAFHEPERDVEGELQGLSRLSARLGERRLVPIATRVRAVCSLRRLLAGLPVVDERAFSDRVTVAVRESDLDTQLLYLAAEGWQCAETGQLVNARFRAQQVGRLAESRHALLKGWSLLLEQVSMLLNSSRVTIREDADLLDLSHTVDNPAEAWASALLLAAAQYDTDLSVWFSLHREVLLEPRFLPIARLALGVMGQRGATVLRLIPEARVDAYRLSAEPEPDGRGRRPDLTVMPELSEVGQVNISLLGGFQVSRNGHQLTSRLWGRKRAAFLAARLTLALGTFVGRHVLIEELWPGTDLSRARQSLYTATSTLRAAFGQVKDGPQYVLTHGDGLGLNTEYVSADTTEFNMLVRAILLQRDGRGSAARAVIDACLKLEKLYVGPLYIPGSGDVTFFRRMRRVCESKYIDCLVKGIDAAMEEEDVTVASWLAEAALKQCPTREDVLRRAMRALDAAGRRREVVNLYASHLYYLRHELKDDLNRDPEEETRRLYEEIVDGTGLQAFV